MNSHGISTGVRLLWHFQHNISICFEFLKNVKNFNCELFSCYLLLKKQVCSYNLYFLHLGMFEISPAVLWRMVFQNGVVFHFINLLYPKTFCVELVGLVETCTMILKKIF